MWIITYGEGFASGIFLVMGCSLLGVRWLSKHPQELAKFVMKKAMATAMPKPDVNASK